MVRLNQNLVKDIDKFLNYVIIVEGKKDVLSLEALGFEKVYAVHETGITLRERVERICSLINLRKDKICILTDFDKKGKKLYFLLKSLFSENGARLDSRFRGILLKAGVSHVEGLYEFLEKSFV